MMCPDCDAPMKVHTERDVYPDRIDYVDRYTCTGCRTVWDADDLKTLAEYDRRYFVYDPPRKENQ